VLSETRLEGQKGTEDDGEDVSSFWMPLRKKYLNFKEKAFYEIMWNANLMQQSNFIDLFLPRHVSGTCAHHQEH